MEDEINKKLAKLSPFFPLMEKKKKREAVFNKIKEIETSIDELFNDDLFIVPETSDITILVNWASEIGQGTSMVHNPYEHLTTIASELVSLKYMVSCKIEAIEAKIRAIWNVGKVRELNPFDKKTIVTHPQWL